MMTFSTACSQAQMDWLRAECYPGSCLRKLRALRGEGEGLQRCCQHHHGFCDCKACSERTCSCPQPAVVWKWTEAVEKRFYCERSAAQKSRWQGQLQEQQQHTPDECADSPDEGTAA